MIPEYFRGKEIPRFIKSKTQLVAWALTEFMNLSLIHI